MNTKQRISRVTKLFESKDLHIGEPPILLPATDANGTAVAKAKSTSAFI